MSIAALPGPSTVTVFRAAIITYLGGEGRDADEILRHIASNMPPMFGAATVRC
jgi:hypothetical protein